LPARVDARADSLASDDVLLRGLAARAGIAAQPLPEGVATPSAGVALLDAGEVTDAAALVARWLSPALDAMRRGELASLALDFADGTRFDLRASQRWRLWRRPLRALA
jgi:hypothetical protein